MFPSRWILIQKRLIAGRPHPAQGLCLRDWRGRSLPPIPLQVGVFIDPSVVAEPSVVLLPDLRSRRTVLLTSVNERRLKLLNVGDCEGFTFSVPGDRDEYVMRREVTMIATTVERVGGSCTASNWR